MPYEYMYMIIAYVVLILMWILAFLSIPLTLMYGVLRSRESGEATRDPQLGMKIALHFLLSMTNLLMITGISIVLSDTMIRVTQGAPKQFLSTPTRVGFAMTLSGLLLAAAHWYFLFTKTNDRHWPIVRRIFTGCRFVVCGIVVTAAFTGTLISAFMDKRQFAPNGNTTTMFFSYFFVWGAAWLVHAWLLMIYSGQKNAPSETGSALDSEPMAEIEPHPLDE